MVLNVHMPMNGVQQVEARRRTRDQDPQTPPTETPAQADRRRRLARIVFLARLMDSSIRLPGVNQTIGIDPLLGLIPGVGDVLGDVVSVYIVYEAWRAGATRSQVARMLGNVVIDGLVGTVPVVGDLFDFAFKANVRNLAILGLDARGAQIHIGPRTTRPSAGDGPA